VLSVSVSDDDPHRILVHEDELAAPECEPKGCIIISIWGTVSRIRRAQTENTIAKARPPPHPIWIKKEATPTLRPPQEIPALESRPCKTSIAPIYRKKE
jgi:hypothetical protein